MCIRTVADLDLLVYVYVYRLYLLNTEGELEMHTGTGSSGDLAEGGDHGLLFFVYRVPARADENQYKDRNDGGQYDFAQLFRIEGNAWLTWSEGSKR